ncbi:hypothetical protein [Streptomyces sp. NPDC058657]|uniref:hypothetical protein n=1 Tax=unclassified Streptomyces TaxID=2593676 RepID=UPI0036699C7D
MSDSTPVPASGVPQFTGDLATLEQQVTALRKGGTQLATQGKSTHTAFQGLSAYYQAPEADRLFATTAPISTLAHDIGEDLGTVADALDTYATAVRPLAKRLAELKAEAQTFASEAAADDTWREDGDKVEENNERRDEISRTLEAFWTAEIECHSKIVKLVDGKTYSLNDGSKSDHLYGYRADDLKGAKGLPWGDPVVESVRWYQSYEYVADFATGVVVDGIGGTLKGLGTLVGVDGWDKAGEAWTGLAKLATGIAMVVVPAGAVAPALLGGDKTRRWMMDSQTALKETGKALVAWDQWGSNPGRAAGAVTFNVVTTVFTGGVGAGVSGAGKAGAVAKALSVAGKAGRVIDPTTYVFKAGAYTGTKIRDLFVGLKNLKQVDVSLPPGTIELPEGTLRNADGTVTIPADVTPPKGAVAQPNGTYTLTDDAVPAGSLRNPDGSDTYLTPEGHVVNGKGEVLSELKNAPDDIVNNPATHAERPGAPSRAETPGTPSRAETPVPERVLVSVGADTVRATPGGTGQLGDMARLGDNAPDHAPRMGNDTPGGTTPGGSAATNPGDAVSRGDARDLPGNGADNPSRGGSGSSGGPEAPGGPRGDGPGGGSHGGGGLDDLGRAGSDAELPGSQADGPPSGTDGTDQSAGDPGGANGASSQGDGQPMLRGGSEEQGVRDGVKSLPGKLRPKPDVLERALERLASEPDGAQVAEVIASGRFSESDKFGEVVSALGARKAQMYQPSADQILFADELVRSGVPARSIDFEQKIPVGADMDIRIKAEDGSIYAYQMKHLNDPANPVGEITRNKYLLQLARAEADHHILLVDGGRGTRADWLSRGSYDELMEIHGGARGPKGQGITFVIRLEDGTLVIPPGSKTDPKDML